MIKSWSFSSLQNYASCPLKAKLKHADRIPDPGPNEAAERGTRIHQLAEDYVRGKIKELPKELEKFRDQFAALKDKDPSMLDMEQEWGVDREWKPAPWKTAWGRIKADCIVRISPTEAVVVDYKTGRRWGNEVKHGEQLQLYSLATFIMYPEIEMVTAELWYLDVDEIADLTVPRRVALNRYLKVFDKRARQMTEATEFPANPNIISCKYCPYGDTGHCDKRVVDKVATANFFKRRNSGG